MTHGHALSNCLESTTTHHFILSHHNETSPPHCNSSPSPEVATHRQCSSNSPGNLTTCHSILTHQNEVTTPLVSSQSLEDSILWWPTNPEQFLQETPTLGNFWVEAPMISSLPLSSMERKKDLPIPECSSSSASSTPMRCIFVSARGISDKN